MCGHYLSIIKTFTDNPNTKAIPNENLLPKLDVPQYLSLDSFDNYTLPEKCSYKSLKKDINNTLKDLEEKNHEFKELHEEVNNLKLVIDSIQTKKKRKRLLGVF